YRERGTGLGGQALRRSSVLLATLLLIVLVLPASGANEEAPQNPALKRLYSDFRTLFRKHYPAVTSHLLKDEMHFESDTRVFIVPEPLRTGEWQDPWETRGPKPGGILCEMSLRNGRYMGAAVVPQTFDKRYFRLLVMAPYSVKYDAHLYVHLSYPGDVRPHFLAGFHGLVNHF